MTRGAIERVISGFYFFFFFFNLVLKFTSSSVGDADPSVVSERIVYMYSDAFRRTKGTVIFGRPHVTVLTF